MVWQNEGEFLTADRKKSAVLNLRTVEAYQWIYNLMYKEKVAPTAAELGNTSVFSAFQSGRIGMMYEIRATSMVLNGVKFNYDVANLWNGQKPVETVLQELDQRINSWLSK